MADKSTDPVPPVPVPPTAAVPPVPPVEPAPKAPRKTTPKATAATVAAAPAVPAPAAVVPPPPPAQTPPPPPAYAAPGYAPAPAGPAQGLSITSMILGIAGVFLSLFGWGLLPAIAGVVTGHIAQKRQPYAKPFWLTGLITGYVGIGISLIWGLFLVLIVIAGLSSYSYFG